MSNSFTFSAIFLSYYNFSFSLIITLCDMMTSSATWLIETSMIREDGWTSSCDFLSASISLRRPIECLEGFPSFLPFSFVFILLSHARCPPLFNRFMDENDHTDLKVLHMGSPHGKPINFFGIFTFTPSNLFHDRSHLLQAIKLYWAPSIVHLICEIIFA